MTHVRLVLGRTYQGLGIRASRDNPVVECDDAKAAALVASGFFTPVDPDGETPGPDAPSDPAKGGSITTYNFMTVAELRKKAAELGVPSKGLGKAALVEALAGATAKELPPTDGSFTMIALQEGE